MKFVFVVKDCKNPAIAICEGRAAAERVIKQLPNWPEKLEIEVRQLWTIDTLPL